jgi:hypothetical protein
MTTVAEIPTQPGRPFSERVTWDGATYTLHFGWNPVLNAWVLDIWDEGNDTAILTGLPLVTGTDILGQFIYLPVGAHTVVTVMGVGPFSSPDAVPTFDNLGSDGRVYLVMP